MVDARIEHNRSRHRYSPIRFCVRKQRTTGGIATSPRATLFISIET